MPNNSQAPNVLTKEMIDELKKQLDEMEGQEISEDSPVQFTNEPSEDVAWYIAYSTRSNM